MPGTSRGLSTSEPRSKSNWKKRQGDDVAGFLDRRRKLRQAFESVPQSFAKHLLDQLADKGDPLARLFKFKTATPTRNEMISILLRKSGVIIDL
jgi:hypothetical protein